MHTLDQISQLVLWDVNSGFCLAEQRDNSLSRVTTNDWDVQALWVLLANDLSNEGLCSDNIKGSNTEKTLGVKDSLCLEDLGGNWDGGVDRV